MDAPGEEGLHFHATLSVPKNAHSMDFVFSNVKEGEGIYDNRGGLDYHLPIEGSEVLRRLQCSALFTSCASGA
jgi:starch synthase